MDGPEDKVVQPHNSTITFKKGSRTVHPGLEQGAGRLYENGTWRERPLLVSKEKARVGSASLHFKLPRRQKDVPLSAYPDGETAKDRLETRLIDRELFSTYMSNTFYSGFSIYIPASVDPVGDTLAPGKSPFSIIHQWHQSSPESPPISLRLKPGTRSELEVWIIHGERKGRETSKVLPRADGSERTSFVLPLDQWIDFVAAWRIDPFSEKGMFDLYHFLPARPTKPPSLIYQYRGKIGYTGVLSRSHLTQAFGMYRAANPTGNWEIFYDQIRTGRTLNSILPWKEEHGWRFEVRAAKE